MKLLPLSKGRFSKVDDDVFDYLNQWHWTYSGTYAVRHTGVWPKNLKKIYLHRFIMNTPDGMDTDHINGDKLDNQRGNLRVCTHAQNLANGKHRSNNTSGFKGVCWSKQQNKWQVHIWKDGKNFSLGYFSDINEAVNAYKQASKEYHGEFANPTSS
jgi:hypothetical protein